LNAKKIADFKKELIDDFFKCNKDEADVFSHFFTDINANYKKRHSVCVLGGFFGEFLITFSAVQELVALEENKENLGMILTWKHKDVTFPKNLFIIPLVSSPFRLDVQELSIRGDRYPYKEDNCREIERD